MREAIGTGPTVVLAKKNACDILAVEDTNVEFEVVQLPEKSFLGLFGGKPAKVKAIIKDSPTDAALNYLEEIISNFDLKDIKIRVEDFKKNSVFQLSGREVKDLCNGKVETLRALQYLTGLVASQKNGSFYNVVIKAENLRDERAERLYQEVKTALEKFSKTKNNFSFPPMSAYDRKLVHEQIQLVDNVESWSEGEGFNRHVVIGIKS